MGFKLAELIVQISGDSAPLNRNLDAVHAKLNGLAGAGGQLGGALLGGLGLTAGIASAAGLGAAIGGAISSASDLNETLSKVDVVFGPAAEEVKAQAQEMADAFGLPKRATLDAAASIGLIGKAAGQSQPQAAAMANQMAELAADASSFYNVPLADALEKIRSGLVGESEPIRAFGVLLSEAAVQQEAVAIGAAKSGDKLSEQAKVMARASLITKGMKDATGDLARTQDSFSNRMRKLQGDLENFGADVGAKLIPPAQELLTLSNELGASFKEAFGTGPIETLADSLKTTATTLRIINQIASDLELKNPFGSWQGALESISGQTLIRGIAGILSPSKLQAAVNKVAPGNMPALKPQARPENLPAAPADSLAAEKAKDAEDLAKAIAKLTGNLKDEVATFGLSARAADVWGLAQKGAGEEAVRMAGSLAAQLDAMDAAKKEQEELADAARDVHRDMADAAQQVIDSTRTPLEKFREEMGRLRALLERGFIDKDTFDRAGKAQQKELDEAQGKGRKTAQVESLDSFARGLLTSAFGGKDQAAQQQLAVQREQLAVQREQLATMRRPPKDIRDRKVAAVAV